MQLGSAHHITTKLLFFQGMKEGKLPRHMTEHPKREGRCVCGYCRGDRRLRSVAGDGEARIQLALGNVVGVMYGVNFMQYLLLCVDRPEAQWKGNSQRVTW